MKKNKNDTFIKACRRQNVPYTPIWIMRQAGRYLPGYNNIRKEHGFLEICKTPSLATEVTIEPVTLLEVDAAIIFSDILLLPEAMGLKLSMQDVVPTLENPEMNGTLVERLETTDISYKLEYVYEGIKLAKSKLNGMVPLIGFAGGPFTLLSYILEGNVSKDLSATRKFLYSEPGLAHNLISKISQAISTHLNNQIRVGANAVQIFESMANFLTPHQLLEFSTNYIKDIVKEIKLKHKNTPVIVFTRAPENCLKQLFETGCNVASIYWTIDISKARKLLGDSMAIQGNLDPAVLLSDKDSIEREVELILGKFGRGNGYIFNLGHGILPNTPLENAQLLVKMVKEKSARYHKA